jgi:hypothetical protein
MSDRRNSSGAAPIVPVRRRGHQLIVERCPHCGRRHVHGDGGQGSPGMHGHRVAHCRERKDASVGYVLGRMRGAGNGARIGRSQIRPPPGAAAQLRRSPSWRSSKPRCVSSFSA